MSSAVDAALVCAITVLALTVVGALGYRLSRSQRDLGSDAERAAYATLHTASLAARHLRSGLTPAGASRASRHLRGLLRCETLLMTDTAAVLAWEGTLPDTPARRERVLLAARGVHDSGRTKVFRGPALRALGLDDGGELLICPLRVNGDRKSVV